MSFNGLKPCKVVAYQFCGFLASSACIDMEILLVCAKWRTEKAWFPCEWSSSRPIRCLLEHALKLKGSAPHIARLLRRLASAYNSNCSLHIRNNRLRLYESTKYVAFRSSPEYSRHTSMKSVCRLKFGSTADHARFQLNIDFYDSQMIRIQTKLPG